MTSCGYKACVNWLFSSSINLSRFICSYSQTRKKKYELRGVPCTVRDNIRVCITSSITMIYSTLVVPDL
jgi:hypothetical protein